MKAPTSMSTKLLIVSLTIGSVFGALTLLLMGRSTDGADPVEILSIPGEILATIAPNTPTDLSVWVAVFGNFAFYFALTYVVGMLWERHTKAAKDPERSRI